MGLAVISMRAVQVKGLVHAGMAVSPLQINAYAPCPGMWHLAATTQQRLVLGPFMVHCLVLPP